MEEQSPSKINFKDRKTILTIVGFLVLLIAIPLGVYLVQQKQIFKPRAGGGTPPPVSGPETSFSLVSSLQGGPNFVPLGQKIRVSLFVRSDIDAANLFAAKLKFPTNILEVEEIITGINSSCELRPACLDANPACKIPEPAEGWCKQYFIKNWVEKNSDNKTGTISLIGGVPAPGYKTTTGQPSAKMAEIVLKTKTAGDAYVDLDVDAAIYRNSDNNNILGIKRAVDFRVLPPTTPTPTSSVTVTTTPTPIISGVISPIPGDVNSDGKITLVDMSALLSKWSKVAVEAGKADLNNDGVVNTVDYSMMIKILLERGIIKSASEAPQPPQ